MPLGLHCQEAPKNRDYFKDSVGQSVICKSNINQLPRCAVPLIMGWISAALGLNDEFDSQGFV